MEQINRFNEILNDFRVNALCIDFKIVDNYFYYDLKLAPKATIKSVEKYAQEISLALNTGSKPSIKVMFEQGIIRLEFIKHRTNRLNLFDYFNNDNIPKGNINCLLGKSVDGRPVWMDLSQNPHMIISGTTGSGKSVLLHNIIANLFNYNNVQLFLLDPKNIEFSLYEKHIKRNIHVGYTYDNALIILDKLIALMEFRYDALRKVSHKKFPYVVLIIDEFSNLIMQDSDNQFYNKLCMLAQKCRAANISIVISTQRPSVNVINGTIKANFAARVACRVASKVDAKVMLDCQGAENLLGKGDALMRDNFRNLERFQVAYTTAEEVCKFFGE